MATQDVKEFDGPSTGCESLPAYRRIQSQLEGLEISIFRIEDLRRRIEGGPSEDVNNKIVNPEMSLNEILLNTPGDLCRISDQIVKSVEDIEKLLFS